MQKVIVGQLVNYEVLGSGKKNLIILHGWGGSLHEWKTVAESLSLRYRVWLLDFPGFGGSPKPSFDWNIYDYANFVKDFIKELKIKDPVILGHSFGGRVAILLKAKKLILVDAAGLRIKTIKATIGGLIFDKLGFMKKYVPATFKNLFGSADYRSAGNMRNIFVKVVNQDLAREMSEVKCPTLIIWGEKDMVLPIWQARKIRELIRNSEVRVVWGADHWPHLSRQKEFLEIIDNFLHLPTP